MRRVRDAAYWGVPVGTPIVAGMKPARAREKLAKATKAATAAPRVPAGAKPAPTAREMFGNSAAAGFSRGAARARMHQATRSPMRPQPHTARLLAEHNMQRAREAMNRGLLPAVSPGSSPPSTGRARARMTAAKRGVPDAPAAAVAKLDAMTSRPAGHDYLAKATKADLISLLDAAGSTTHRRGDTKERLRNSLVELTIGRRADSAAIMRVDLGSPRASMRTSGQVQDSIRSAYERALARKPNRETNRWVSLEVLRDELAGEGLTRTQVDAALVQLNRTPNVHIVPESNQKVLTQGERAAAVMIGNQAKHHILIQQHAR